MTTMRRHGSLGSSNCNKVCREDGGWGIVTGILAFPEGFSRVDLGMRRSRWKTSGFGEALVLLYSGSAKS